MSEQTYAITVPALGDTFTKELSPLERKVAELKIVDAATHAEALELGKRIRTMQRFVVDLLADSKKRFHDGHKAVCAQERRWLLPLDKSQSLLGAKLSDFETNERRRAEEEARQRQLEAQRIEEERQLQEAVAAEEAGDTVLAEAILEAPVSETVVLPTPRLAQVAGASSRSSWKAEVVDLAALVRHAAAHPEHIGLLEPNQPALNQMARALKQNMRIPGVRPVEATIRSYRDDT